MASALLSRVTRLEDRAADGDGERWVVFVMLRPGEPPPDDAGGPAFTLDIRASSAIDLDVEGARR